MFERWAQHLTAGARKYDKRNWMKAQGREERDRFRESALRHFIQWYRGERDEDHASAVFFNINGAEFVGQKKEYEAKQPGLVTTTQINRAVGVPQSRDDYGLKGNSHYPGTEDYGGSDF